MRIDEIQNEWTVFAQEGAVGIGAVRSVASDHIRIHIEGFGEQDVTAEQIASVHDGKVILKPASLPEDVRAAIAHAHDQENWRAADRAIAPDDSGA